MIYRKTVTSCDFSGKSFPDAPQAGCAFVAQGATGRWCEVMYGGEAILAQEVKSGNEILSYDEARRRCNEMENSYADF